MYYTVFNVYIPAICSSVYVYIYIYMLLKIHVSPFNSTSYVYPRPEIWLKPVTEQIYLGFALIFSSSFILPTPCILFVVRLAK